MGQEIILIYEEKCIPAEEQKKEQTNQPQHQLQPQLQPQHLQKQINLQEEVYVLFIISLINIH